MRQQRCPSAMLLLLIAVGTAGAAHADTRGHAVGYRELPLNDSARAGGARADAGRGINVKLWYPASPAKDSRPIAQRDYFGADASALRAAVESAIAGRQGCLALDEAMAALDVPARAHARPEPTADSHPLLLVSGGVDPWLAEDIAARGWIVAAVEGETWGFGVEDAVDDLLFVQRESMNWTFASREQRAVMGTGYHGFIAALAQLRGTAFAAVVSIDGAEAWKSWGPQTMDLPYAQPALLRAPWLRFHDEGRDVATIDRKPFWDAAYSSDRHEMTFANPRNILVEPMGMIARACPNDPAAKNAHAVLRETIPAFLDAALADEPELLRWQPALPASAQARHRHFRADAPLPSIADALRMQAEGAQLRLIEQLAQSHAAGNAIPSFYWSEILSPAFNAGDTESAAAIANEYLRQQPQAAGAHYLKAVVSTQQGRLEEAASHYERCLALATDLDFDNGPGGYRIEQSYRERATRSLRRIRERLQQTTTKE